MVIPWYSRIRYNQITQRISIIILFLNLLNKITIIITTEIIIHIIIIKIIINVNIVILMIFFYLSDFILNFLDLINLQIIIIFT